MLTRSKPPNRRLSANIRFDFKGQTFFITYGMLHDLTIVEVFGNSSKLSSDMDFLISDACIILSIALQSGSTLDDLAKSMKKSHSVDGESAAPASLIGVIVSHLIGEQAMLDALAQDLHRHREKPKSAASDTCPTSQHERNTR